MTQKTTRHTICECVDLVSERTVKTLADNCGPIRDCNRVRDRKRTQQQQQPNECRSKNASKMKSSQRRSERISHESSARSRRWLSKNTRHSDRFLTWSGHSSSRSEATTCYHCGSIRFARFQDDLHSFAVLWPRFVDLSRFEFQICFAINFRLVWILMLVDPHFFFALLFDLLRFLFCFRLPFNSIGFVRPFLPPLLEWRFFVLFFCSSFLSHVVSFPHKRNIPSSYFIIIIIATFKCIHSSFH